MSSYFETLNAARWPALQRAAVLVLIAVDAPSPGSSNDDGLDYTATGINRLIRILRDLDLSATLAFTPAALSSLPQLARLAQDAGNEIAPWSTGTADDGQRWPAISDIEPTGHVARLPYAPHTREQVEESARTLTSPQWRITGAGGDLPVLPAAGDGDGTVVIPVSPFWTDRAWLDPARPLPPSSFLEMWSLSLASVRTEGGLMTVVLHPHIAGRPGIAEQVVRFLDEVIESGDTWVATAAQIASWWREQSRTT